MVKRRKFSAEYKARLVLELLSGQRSAADIARKDRIKDTLLYEWRAQFLERAPALAYVTNRNEGTVTEVDLLTRRVVRTIDVGDLPWGVSVDQKSGDVFVANFGSNNISCIERSTNQVINFTTLSRAAHLFFEDVETNTMYAVGRNGIVLRVFCRDSTGGGQIADNSLFDVVLSNGGAYGYVTATDSKRVYGFGRLQGKFISLPNAPYAIEELSRCMGVVVAAEDRLYLLDYVLFRTLRTFGVGKQTVSEGGQGIAYNDVTDTVYVTNYGANSITSIAKPCPPLPTPNP